MHRTFDVVTIGGGVVIGSSVACHLSANPAFAGRIAVVERGPTYTSQSGNTCIDGWHGHPPTTSAHDRKQAGCQPATPHLAYSKRNGAVAAVAATAPDRTQSINDRGHVHGGHHHVPQCNRGRCGSGCCRRA